MIHALFMKSMDYNIGAMKFQNKLQELRKVNKMSQEELADRIGVSRQAVAKWEGGQAYPDIDNLILLSEEFKVTIDRLVKEDEECSQSIIHKTEYNARSLISFLINAKKHTYAAAENQSSSSRPNSIDYRYEEGEYLYMDTYLGGEYFSGEEAVWKNELPQWAMNYSGRVTGENFSGDFLKEALMSAPKDMPYRGPGFYRNGDYSYHCKIDGGFEWFQGYEDIYLAETKIYECYFHGGVVR